MDGRLTHEDLDWLRKMSELKVANRPPRGIPTSVARKLTSLGYVEARPGGENWERYSIARKGRAELAGRLYSAFRLLALAPFSAPANSRLTARRLAALSPPARFQLCASAVKALLRRPIGPLKTTPTQRESRRPRRQESA